MEGKNQTWMDYFVIKGITDLPELQTPIFLLVLLIYITILGGNATILLLICLNPHLHTPMYHFLSNLSALDICYTTVTMHSVLISYASGDKRVSFSGCIAQMYFYVSFLCCEFMLLTAMSYDRYVAICNPLRYATIMNSRACLLLMGACWVLGFAEVVPAIFIIYNIYCFRSNEVNHFFCDLLAVMKLFCSRASVMEHLIYIESVFIGFIPFSLTIMSYGYIIQTITRINSNRGKRKAFYTCSSHLTVVSLLYVTIFCMYMRPTSSFTLDSDKLFSLLYTTLTPLLNPLIYSLKNKDVKAAVTHLLKRNKIISM
ncbi:olfactory receptor 13C9-like [Spea bombifrons]|uniref:olfactory receptor 13C9-like n=1 Tax=Spea bombifrons TaxID=233779 RepID=UPI0023497FA1|nr:olfactory receptor 13C9-like [Spea bombifrons]